jgi:glycerophosphoryl diester phosphodiesterase
MVGPARTKIRGSLAGLCACLAAGPWALQEPAERGRGALLERRSLLPGGAQLLQPPELPGGSPQWLQGISAVVELGPERFLALLDNGNGAPENSRECLLALVEFRVAGTAAVPERTIFLSDPAAHLPFALVRGQDPGRPLTGADLDPESLARLPDGSLWIGDEFGPFLLHFDADGRLLAPPFELLLPANAGALAAGASGLATLLPADHPGDGSSPTSAEADPSGPPPDNPPATHRLRSPHHPAFGPATLLRWLSSLDLTVRKNGAGPLILSPARSLLLEQGEPFDRLGLESLRRAGFPVIPWTVNGAAEIDALLSMDVDGLISDDPGLVLERLRAFASGAEAATARSKPRAPFDVQGHRGARALRPENSLPAFELALDLGATTLELDCQLTADGRLLLAHDRTLPHGALRARRADRPNPEAPVASLTLAEVRDLCLADGLDPDFAAASSDPQLSPVALAFARTRGWDSAHTPLELPDLVHFVEFYRRHYELGDGRDHGQSAPRARHAAAARFNIELKTSPEEQRDGAQLDAWILALERAFERAPLGFDRAARAMVQCFDARVLRRIRGLPVAWLVAPQSLGAIEPPGSAAPRAYGPTLWMAGEPGPLGGPGWEAAPRAAELGATVRPSGGFEGLCRDPRSGELLALLEKPLAGPGPRELLLFGFQPPEPGSEAASQPLPARVWRYPLSPRANAAGDLQWLGEGRLLVLERDDSQGDLGGWKRLFEVRLGAPGSLLEKTEVADLLDLALPADWRSDPDLCAGLFAGALPLDVGLPGDPRSAAESAPSDAEARFALPYVTIETALPLADGRLLIVNDNNFPHSVGRHLGSGRPDDTEWVWLRLRP